MGQHPLPEAWVTVDQVVASGEAVLTGGGRLLV